MKFGTKSVLLACLLLVGLSFAQVAANNLINVNVSNIKTEIAKNINVNVSQIPVTVQAPIDVAAAVCGVSVDVLTAQATQGNNSCTAKNDTRDVNSMLKRKITRAARLRLRSLGAAISR